MRLYQAQTLWVRVPVTGSPLHSRKAPDRIFLNKFSLIFILLSIVMFSDTCSLSARIKERITSQALLDGNVLLSLINQ